MKKISAFILTAALSSTVLFGSIAYAAANTVSYYDVNGNKITVSGMYYDQNGDPVYNENCYYRDTDGNQVYVGGCRAYYYDADGKLAPGSCYYDDEGNPVNPPDTDYSGYRGGCGYRSAQGSHCRSRR